MKVNVPNQSNSPSTDEIWELDRPTIDWLDGIDELRQRTRAQVPVLTQHRRLPPGFRVLRVGGKFGLAVGIWSFKKRHLDQSASRSDISRRVRLVSEDLGPTFIKLLQIISSGEGLFPVELVAECKKCRDQVPPISWEVAKEIIERELGGPLSEFFEYVDSKPLAAASIAQVHAATLLSGERVVIKVQRPTIEELVAKDIAAMSWLAPFMIGRIPVAALANPPALVELFADCIVEELDFRLEAANMLDCADMLAELRQTTYVVPRPHPSLVTKRVLVMERLDGFAFDDVVGMTKAGVNTEEVVRTGMIAFLEGAMLKGIFHGDLHGGNLFVMPDGRTALLDFGIVARLSDFRRKAFLRLLVGATMNDIEGQLGALRDLGALPMDTDLKQVIRDLNLDGPPIDPTKLTGDEMVNEIQKVVKALLGYGARMPKELMLYVKNLVFLDGAIARLAPNLDMFEEIANVATHLATNHGDQIAADIGVDLRNVEMDFTGIKASFGVNPDEVSSLTYSELLERRALINERLVNRSNSKNSTSKWKSASASTVRVIGKQIQRLRARFVK